MKAISTDGTIFTYDAEINGWLMPEVTVLEEQGFISNFFNFPNFDGAVISTLSFTATLARRAPIGQIIVGGVLFNMWLYSIYEMSTVNYSDADFELCNYFKQRCFVPNCIDCCQNCYWNCITEKGAWPFEDCPY